MSAPDRGEAPDAGRRHLDELLDEALQETFPASDTPAVGVEAPLSPRARAATRQAAAAPRDEAPAGSPDEQPPGGLSSQP
jgi:hypothetical protein